MDDPIWISETLALTIHARQLSEHGGQEGVRDQGLLQSALGKPRNLFGYTEPTPTIPALAAAYAFGIARNHPFLDGNKRTAAVVCELFIELNGWQLTANDADWTIVMLQLAAGELSEQAFTDWLSAHTKRA
ncbi:MAG: type II toxin-antitoxin system death-on-curing family toxin [Tepidisphaeraceae bacterium]